MSEIRVLIVDDEPMARAAIRELLRADADVVVVGECRNGREASEALRRGGVDLVFLDVQMPELDGVSVVAQLDGQQLPVIIFVTAYDQYTLRAFDLHAVDYLLKPFTDERFYAALRHAKQLCERGITREVVERLRSLLAEHEQLAGTAGAKAYWSRIPVRRDDAVLLIPVRDVDWIEAEGDYARLHVAEQQYLIRETMGGLEVSLDPAQFARIHRSTIVNLNRVRELRPLFKGDHDVILHNGTTLRLSRHYKESIEKQLGRAL